jgi:hypothetical protein
MEAIVTPLQPSDFNAEAPASDISPRLVSR